MLSFLPDSQPWMLDAHCTTSDPEAWFPDQGVPPRAAKKICRGCPVIEECLQWALANNEIWGVWGGESFLDRRRIKAKDVAA